MLSFAQPETETALFDLDLIYSPDPRGFKYSLPRPLLESYLSGNSFDHQRKYTEEESRNLRADIQAIAQAIHAESPIRLPLAIMTAGSPGTGKTTLMKQDRDRTIKEGKTIAYICPDDVCLKTMKRTYLADIEGKLNNSASDEEKKQILVEGYNKWRPGSNGAAHLILAHLIRQNYAFYFGTTSSGPATHFFLDFLKQKGYQIKLLHISSPDDVRWDSIKERDKTFVQTTEDDIKEKGKLVPQRINDTYLKYADMIEFYFRDGVHDNAKIAAKWIRHEKNEDGLLGTLTIIDQASYDQIKNIHNAVCDILGQKDLRWEASIEKVSEIIHYP